MNKMRSLRRPWRRAKHCEAKGTHKEYNFIRNVWCSLPENHNGRHIAYWNNIITDKWVEQESGEIGGKGGGEFFDWE